MSRPKTETSVRTSAEGTSAPAAQHGLPSPRMAAQQRMAGQISHDLNNYLTVFLGYGELLQSIIGEDARAQKYLSEMVRAGARAADYTRQLQAFGGRQVVDLDTVELNAFLESFQLLLETVLGETMELRLDLEPGLPLVDLDRELFQHVVVTLARAARESTSGHGTFRIETQRASVNGNGRAAVVLRMTDSSGAVPEDGGEALFEPFATGDGRSLDLAAAYGCIVQHGASVQAERLSSGDRCVTIRISPGLDG